MVLFVLMSRTLSVSDMLGGAVGLPTSAAAAASAAAVAVAAHKQFHPNSPPLDLDSWKEVFLQQANTNGNNTKNNVSTIYSELEKCAQFFPICRAESSVN